MSGLITGLVLGIVVIVLVSLFNYKKKKKSVGLNWLLGIVPVAAALVLSMVAVVPANSVGVVYSPFSGVKEDTLSEGWHYKGIFDEIYVISSEVQTREIMGVTGQTKDAQFITMNIDVKYMVNPDEAFKVFKQYRTLDNVARTLIAPTVQRSIEAISTRYNVIEVLGEKRNEMYSGIEKELEERFSDSGISFVSVNFNDTDAGEAIEKAIQEEAVAKKAVETAEQERLKAEIEAQKRVIEAQADQQKAQIEAETKIIEAEAEAKANDLVSKSITNEILQKYMLEKWNGQLPVVTDGSNVIFDIGDIIKDKNDSAETNQQN